MVLNFMAILREVVGLNYTFEGNGQKVSLLKF